VVQREYKEHTITHKGLGMTSEWKDILSSTEEMKDNWKPDPGRMYVVTDEKIDRPQEIHIAFATWDFKKEVWLNSRKELLTYDHFKDFQNNGCIVATVTHRMRECDIATILKELLEENIALKKEISRLEKRIKDWE